MDGDKALEEARQWMRGVVRGLKAQPMNREDRRAAARKKRKKKR